MTSLPSGLAFISSRLDDSPQVRGAVDMARRIRRADALSRLAEMDAPLIGGGTEFVTLQDLEIREGDDGTTVMRKFRASMAYAKAAAAACRQADEGVNYEPLTSAIDRHAALVIGSAYKGRDRR